MNSIPTSNRRGEPIQSVLDWERRASPGPRRWAEGYSAYALADAWINGAAAADALALLEQAGTGAFEGPELDRAIAEAQTHFDQWGGPRNHDLLIRAHDARGKFPVCVEAKVNESFGETIDRYWASGRRKRERGETTHAPERLAGLLTAIAGADLNEKPDLDALRYQLFSATAGAIAEAVEGRAVLLVHEFVTPRADPEAQLQNQGDLGAFLERIFDVAPPQTAEWLVGPVHAARSTDRISADVNLWIGHLTTTVQDFRSD